MKHNKRVKPGSSPNQLTIVFEAAAVMAQTEGTKNGTGANETAPSQRESVPPTREAEATRKPASTTSVNIGTHVEQSIKATAAPKKRKWYSLMDKVYAITNLNKAWERVESNKGAAGIDRMTVKAFAANAGHHLSVLSNDLKEKKYRPAPVRRHYIDKADGGKRPLGIPTVRDRVVQQALHQVLSPIFETVFSDRSHGFRPERGTVTAISTVDRAVWHGYDWIVDADIKGFFDNVDHDLLLGMINEEVSDGSVLRLIRLILEAGVVEPNTADLEPSDLGTPQGGPLSPLLANIYLHRLDVSMEQAGYGLVRYADDFVILSHSRSEAEAALELARQVLDQLQLQLHPGKTRVVPIDVGFDFLGFNYRRSKNGQLVKVVRAKSGKKFREAIRSRTPRIKNQRKPKARCVTRQRLASNPRFLGMIADVNRHLRAWHHFFKGVRGLGPPAAFDKLDAFVRARLRTALTGRVGPGWWHSRLPNALFAEFGLVSLVDLQQAHLRRSGLRGLAPKGT